MKVDTAYMIQMLTCIGESPDTDDIPVEYFAAQSIYPEKEGVLVSIEEISDAKNLGQVAYFKDHSKVGRFVGFDKHGGGALVELVLQLVS